MSSLRTKAVADSSQVDRQSDHETRQTPIPHRNPTSQPQPRSSTQAPAYGLKLLYESSQAVPSVEYVQPP